MFQLFRNWRDRSRTLRELAAGAHYERRFEVNAFDAELRTALQARDAGDHARALALRRRLRQDFPKLSMESEPGLKLLIDLGAFDEADALMAEGRRSFPR
jgi:hypothetical protein